MLITGPLQLRWHKLEPTVGGKRSHMRQRQEFHSQRPWRQTFPLEQQQQQQQEQQQEEQQQQQEQQPFGKPSSKRPSSNLMYQ